MPEQRLLNAGRFLEKAGNQNRSREYQNKEAVFSQGDAADAAFYIQSGNVKFTVVSTRGKRAVIGILGRGDLFGESCLEKYALRISTATAIEQSFIIRVPQTELARIIRQEPAFAKLFVSHLLDRISRTESAVIDQLFNDSEKRLARVLALLAGFGEQSSPKAVTLHIGQGTLAEMVGTTRSRVSFFMNRFRKMGFIHYNGGIQVRKSLLAFLRNGKPQESK